MAAVLFSLVCLLACNKPLKVGVEDAKPLAGITVEFPHSERFKKTAFHGSQYLSDSFQCAKCHGPHFDGGNTRVSCKNCHSNFPHEAGWSKSVNHGKAFLALAEPEKKRCLACHVSEQNKDAVNEDKIPKCVDCHKAYPHDTPVDEGFRQGEGSHKSLATSYDGKCLVCHRNASENMPNTPGGCTDCHGGKMEISWKSKAHDEGWAKPQVHGKAFASLPEAGRKDCMKCHATPAKDPANAKQTPACVDCHTAYPHDYPVNEEFRSGEGSHATQAKSYPGKCTTCHRNYVDNMPIYGADGGCISCHTGVVEAGWKAAPPAAGQASFNPLRSTTKLRMPSSKKR